MKLPTAPKGYGQPDEQNARNEIARADAENFKKFRDLRLENGERIILKSPDGTLYALTVDNAGALSTVAA